MSRVCPSCEQLPDPQAAVGASCTACGARLVTVATTDPLIGTILDGRFDLRERIGAGAMGVVYRATQVSIGRDVAVKVMTGMDAIAVKRFFREAQIASALAHPNTVQVVEFGQGPDGRVYLAMELVRGHTLYQEIQTGPLLPRRICAIGTQLCDALGAAHHLTIVHRDLKLENVMISTDGTDHVKILDFGIARVLGDASAQLTAAGLIAGTPSYMAPEVLARGAAPAPPQDMYALGVILAELALGRSLWSMASLNELLVAKVSSPQLDEVPARFRPLVRRLIDPDPDRRPVAAEARRLLRELDRVATDPVGVAVTAASMQALAAQPAPAELSFPAVMELVHVSGERSDERSGERSGEQSDAQPPAVVTESPSPQAARFAPSREANQEIKLAVEDRPRAPRSSYLPRSAVPDRFSASPPSRSSHGLATLLILVGVAAAGAYYFVIRTPAGQRGDQSVPDRTGIISIRIIGAAGTPIQIDGHDAGKTPISLERGMGQRPITIEAPGFFRRVIPDHNQTIDVSHP